MSDRLLRRLIFVYPLLMLLCGLGYARWDTYQMDGDAVSFENLADYIQQHDWAHVLNGYWNPAYSFLLVAGRTIAHPTRWHALQVDFYVNLVIFAAAIAAVSWLVVTVVRFRERLAGSSFVLPLPALLLFAWAIIFYAWQREQSLGKVRSDGLIFIFFVLAAAFTLRLFTRLRMLDAVLLGLALGGSYLTKSFGFVASLILLAMILLCGLLRREYGKKLAVASILAGFVFLLVIAPYVIGISRQRDRFTFGDSSRLLYAWFIDGTNSAHEWQVGPVVKTTLELKHHERLLMDNPTVYSYDQHLYGSFPLWFDPAWWHDKTTPHIAIGPQLHLLARNLVLDLRFVEEHPEAIVFVLVLLLIGCRPPSRLSEWIPAGVLSLWALSMVFLYSLMVLQDRYLTAPWLFLVLLFAASLRVPSGQDAVYRTTAVALVLLLAGLSCTDAAMDLARRRRALSLLHQATGAYDPDVYGAAHGLAALGVQPGDRIACASILACVNPYWIWLTGAHAVAEVAGPGDSHTAFWNNNPNKAAMTTALRSVHAKALVTITPPGEQPPTGWQRLDGSTFSACLIDPKPGQPACTP